MKRDNKLFYVLGILICLTLIFQVSARAEKIKIRVIVSGADIYLKPSADSLKIGTIPLGAILEVEKQISDWFAVNLPPDENGIVVTGFINKQSIEVLAEEEAVEEPEAPEEPQPAVRRSTPPPPPPDRQSPPPPPQRRIPPPPPTPEPAPYRPGLEFGLKLRGGGTFLFQNDINEALKGMTDYWKALSYVSVSEEFSPVKMGLDAGAEIFINFTPNIGLGFGAGIISAGKESTVRNTWDSLWGDENYDDTVHPKFKAIPLFFNLYFGFPSGPMNIVFHAGGGFYIGTFDWSYHFVLIEDTDYYYEETWSAKKNTFGFQTGIDIELKLMQSFAFIIGVEGRFAKFSGLTGDLSWKDEGPYWSDSGTVRDLTLWYAEADEGSLGTFPIILFDDSMPTGSWLNNVREAAVSLNGISAKVGFKVSFK